MLHLDISSGVVASRLLFLDQAIPSTSYGQSDHDQLRTSLRIGAHSVDVEGWCHTPVIYSDQTDSKFCC